jgi:hypothetical protein
MSITSGLGRDLNVEMFTVYRTENLFAVRSLTKLSSVPTFYNILHENRKVRYFLFTFRRDSMDVRLISAFSDRSYRDSCTLNRIVQNPNGGDYFSKKGLLQQS